MAGYIMLLAMACVAVSGAPPAPPRLYQQNVPAHFQHPLDFFTENSEVANYYQQQAQQKQGSAAGSPARLENLEPDSEVELLPGAQQPQQPPQQTPNLPGLVPGQRVFIVHMPVPGYRPGTIGGYQPVYIVAAAPQGNSAAGFPNANGYQNAVLLSPGAQAYSPFLGYPGAGAGLGQVPVGPAVGPVSQPGGLLLGYNRPFEQAYHDAAVVFQPGPPQSAGGAGAEGGRGAVHLSQLVNLQTPVNAARGNAQEQAASSDSKRAGEAESAELKEEPRRNRPAPAHARKP